MDEHDVTLERSGRGRMARLLTLLLVLVIVAEGFMLLKVRDEQRIASERAAKAQERLVVEEQRLRLALTSGAELEGVLERLERENGELIELKKQLSSDVAAKDEELAQLKKTYEQLEERMSTEIKSGDIKLTQIGGRLQVDLIDKILFDSGEADISKRGQEVLSRVGAILATMEDKQIQVSGHTDDSPPTAKIADRFPTNWELSATRATNVVRFLHENANVPGKRLVASGHGQFRPVGTNANPVGRARNRRIEILLIPLIEPVRHSARGSSR